MIVGEGWRSSRRHRWIIATLAGGGLLLVLLAALWLLGTYGSPQRERAAPAAPVEQAQAPLPDASEVHVDVAAANANEVSSGVEKVEVCGTGWVDAEADGAIDLESILASPAISEARSRLLDALSSSGDPFAQAARLTIELGSKGEGTGPLVMVELACKAGPCDATEKDRQTGDALFEQLAKLATASTDPRVYGLAYEVCRWRQGAGPCSVLNAAQWAHLDADNGYPWTYILAEAIAAQEPAAIDDALFHIGAASRFEERDMAVAAMVASQAGRSEEERFAAEKLGEVAASLTASPSVLDSVSRSCSKDALLEPNRRELCESAASALAERADSIGAIWYGSAIGRRLGWPPERFEPLDAIYEAAREADSLSGKLTDPSRPATKMRGPLDCAAIDKMLRYVREVASLGEVGYARQWLERSGKTAEYVQRGRERHAMLVARDAAEAARRASAPRR
jgi:hypothetical protein